MFFTTKGFFGGLGGALLLLSLYCTSGLYFANLCIVNYTLQSDLWKVMEQNFDIPNPL